MTTRARVRDVEPLHDYTLRIGFSDGSIREVDLEPELWGPVFEPLRDLDEFRKVAVDPELGTIVWPNGADLDHARRSVAGRPAGHDGYLRGPHTGF